MSRSICPQNFIYRHPCFFRNRFRRSFCCRLPYCYASCGPGYPLELLDLLLINSTSRDLIQHPKRTVQVIQICAHIRAETAKSADGIHHIRQPVDGLIQIVLIRLRLGIDDLQIRHHIFQRSNGCIGIRFHGLPVPVVDLMRLFRLFQTFFHIRQIIPHPVNIVQDHVQRTVHGIHGILHRIPHFPHIVDDLQRIQRCGNYHEKHTHTFILICAYIHPELTFFSGKRKENSRFLRTQSLKLRPRRLNAQRILHIHDRTAHQDHIVFVIIRNILLRRHMDQRCHKPLSAAQIFPCRFHTV